MKEPNDDNLTVSPFSRQSVISFKTSSTNADDSVRDSPTCRYTASHRSARVTAFRVPVIACPNSRRRTFVSEIKRLLTRGQWYSALHASRPRVVGQFEMWRSRREIAPVGAPVACGTGQR